MLRLVLRLPLQLEVSVDALSAHLFKFKENNKMCEQCDVTRRLWRTPVTIRTNSFNIQIQGPEGLRLL
jgi:hypothetical protein